MPYNNVNVSHLTLAKRLSKYNQRWDANAH